MSFWRYLLYISLPLFLLDLGTKEWVVRHYPPPTDYEVFAEPIIPGFFEWVRLHNTGIAFGIRNGASGSNWLFGGIALAALGFVGWLWKRGAFPTRITKVAAVLLISGVIGNLVDRIFRGYVVDMIHVNVGFMWWPAFNVADSCICVAAALLFLSAFQKTPAPVKSSPAAE